MQTENLVLHNSGHRYIVKQGSEHHPYIFIAEFLLTLLIKPINLSDSSGLVIASGEMDTFRVSYLQSH